ncbi:MAG: lysylphosphatidylglycerol synthase transmembrane domain-containing protein [Candidatus Krumholzibacteriia bacterium]
MHGQDRDLPGQPAQSEAADSQQTHVPPPSDSADGRDGRPPPSGLAGGRDGRAPPSGSAGGRDGRDGQGDLVPPLDSDDRQVRREQRFLNRRTVVRGLVYSMILALVGLTILFLITRTPQTFEALGEIDLRYLGLALALVPADLFLGGLRTWVLLRRIQRGTGLWLAIKGYVANTFLGAVTPSQLGGGIAQLYIYRQGGVPLPRGVAVTVMTFLSTLTFFLFAGTAALVAIRDLLSGDMGRRLILYGAFAVVAVLAFFVFSIWKPVAAGRTLRKLGKVLEKVHRGTGRRLRDFSDRAIHELEKYHENMIWLFRRQPWSVALNFLITAALYMVKFTIGYVIVLGLGVEAAYWQVVAIQAVLLAILYFAPTPGGSGLAELGTGAFMSLVLPGYLLPIFTLLSRFFLVYTQASLGAVIMLRRLARDSRR